MILTKRISGGGWFRTGSICLLVFAAVHLIPFFAGLFGTPTDPREIEVDRALRVCPVDIRPFHTTWWHLTMLLSASYSVFLIYVGVVNLVAVRAAAAAGRLRALTVANLIFCIILAGLCAAAWFPPPFVFTVLSSICFGISLMRQPRVLPDSLANG